MATLYSLVVAVWAAAGLAGLDRTRPSRLVRCARSRQLAYTAPHRGMQPFFLWLEATSLSVWIRESTSVFAFPAFLTAHAIGMGLAVGVNAAIALRLLGFAPSVPLGELKRFVPVMWLGFWVNAASGLLLLVGYPTKGLTNPVFYFKLLLIALGMWLFRTMSRRLDEGGLSQAAGPATDRLVAVVSLTCWVGAITSGRLLAYTATRILATW